MKAVWKKNIWLLMSLLPAFLYSGCGQQAKKSTSYHDTVLEDILRQKATNPKDVVTWLKKCATECRAPDSEIANDMAEGYQILFAVSEQNPVFNQLTTEQKTQVSLGQLKVRTAFVKILQTKTDREILETAYRELVNPNSLYASQDMNTAKAIGETIERLKAKPETLATAWYLKAISTPANVDTILDVMSSYKSCLDANKADFGCQSAYKDLARFYERPRCRDNAFVGGTQFLGALVKKDLKHGKKINFYGKDYFLAKAPTIAADDILEASLESLGPDQYEIWFSLKTFSSNKLLKFTEEGLKQKSSLVLSFNGKILAEAPVLQPINDGQFRMPFANSGQAEEAFEKICGSISHDKIPDNLKLSAN